MRSVTRPDMMKLAGAAAATAMLPAWPVLNGQDPAPTDRKGTTMPANMLLLDGMYEGGKYMLPKLPYAVDALQPAYEAKTIEIHHDKHHAAYVNGLNATLDKLAAARQANDFAAIKGLSIDLAFNGSGHVLHTLFWNSMAPGGKKAPASLVKAKEASFGTVEAAAAQFVAAANGTEGSGWAVLAWEPAADKLLILQCEKHQNLTVWGVVPLLVCDVWEHAYYLQYQNRRPDWTKAFMQIANWEFAAARLDAAQKAYRA